MDYFAIHEPGRCSCHSLVGEQWNMQSKLSVSTESATISVRCLVCHDLGESSK